jgi:hypothetical protein
VTDDDEQFERIPWDQIKPTSNSRARVIYLAAAALVVASVSAAVARNFAGSPPLPPTATPAATVPAPSVPPTVSTASTAVSAAPAPATVWAEADLMAVHPESLEAEAAAVAEWLAADYFTVDGSAGWSDHLASLLPPGSPVPQPAAGYRSFVEWAQTVAVSESGPGEFVVTVIVRRLAATDPDPYQRLPLQALDLKIRWTDEGWSVLDLPSPAPTPQLAPAPPWSVEEPPEEVAAAALAKTGGEGAVLGGSQEEGGWRVVVEVVESTGGRWPLAVWVAAADD